MNQILSQLNPVQRQAVLHKNGPLLLLAGAGSGKTKTLTHRIAHLISQGISPYRILAVTFTNKAAQEMKERAYKLIKTFQHPTFNIRLPISDLRLPFLGTFHSICARFLRQEIHHLGYNKNFNIYDADDQLSAVKQSMRKLNYNTNEINPRSIHAMISSAKNELETPDQMKARSSEYIEKITAQTYQVYQQFLKENNALDFDDLIMLTIKLFKTNPQILKKYQQKFSHILVDEYQDTNRAQYIFIKLLTKQHQNITVVGDDWQSIYSWRGANIGNILNFEKDFPNTRTLKLEQNYRSTQNILNAAHCVIEKNKSQKKKKLWTKNQPGEKPSLFEAEDEKSEANFIIQEIINKNQPFNNFVILYRTNAQSRALEETSLKNNIPYKIVGGLRFYERKEIKDILAYLRLINSPEDSVSLNRIINVPPKRIGSKTIGRLEKLSKEKKLDYITAAAKAGHLPLQNQIRNNLQQFGLTMQYLQKKAKKINLTFLIDLLLSKTNYKDFILDGSEEGEYRWENIQELKTVAGKYDNSKNGLANFLEEVALIADIDQVDDKKNAITLMTVHSAKGLEFNTVFIAGLEENLFPHSRSAYSDEELEEERRLCYVAMTRAQKKLYLIHAKSREIYGNTQANPPSRFIKDIPKKLLEKRFTKKQTPLYKNKIKNCEFKSGDKVSHQQFGQGLVIGFQKDLITVIFANTGIKKLSLKFAKLKKL